MLNTPGGSLRDVNTGVVTVIVYSGGDNDKKTAGSAELRNNIIKNCVPFLSSYYFIQSFPKPSLTPLSKYE